MDGVSLNNYLIVEPDEFAYVTVTSRNGEKISLAHNNSYEAIICSSSYITFKVISPEKLIPSYLSMFLEETSSIDIHALIHGEAQEKHLIGEICRK